MLRIDLLKFFIHRLTLSYNRRLSPTPLMSNEHGKKQTRTNSQNNSYDLNYVRNDLLAALKMKQLPTDLVPGLVVTASEYLYGGQVPPAVDGDLRGGKTMLLIGDSRAAIWHHALKLVASKRGYKLHLHYIPSCETIDYPAGDREELLAQCKQRMELNRKIIPVLNPDIVVIAHHHQSSEPKRDRILGAYQTFAQSLQSEGLSPVVVLLGDNPELPGVTQCLTSIANYNSSSNSNGKKNKLPPSIQACARSRWDVVKSEWIGLASIVAKKWGFFFLDTTDFFCSLKCPSVVRNNRVYIDDSHPSPDYVRYLAPQLEHQMEELGVFNSR